MLTVSLHGINIHAPIGLYPEEKITGNDFEVNVDVWLPDELPWPFADYTIINRIVNDIFAEPGEIIEQYVHNIHAALRAEFDMAEKVRVSIKKLNPPMPGKIAYSMVCYEK